MNKAQKMTQGEYGWFSQQSKAEGNPIHIYLDKSGARVEVTCVTQTTNHGSGWNDLVNVGKVYKYVESRQTSQMTSQMAVDVEDLIEIEGKMEHYTKMLTNNKEQAKKLLENMNTKDTLLFKQSCCKINRGNFSMKKKDTDQNNPNDVFLLEFQNIRKKLRQYKKCLAMKRKYTITISRKMKVEDALLFLKKLLKIGINKSSEESIQFIRCVRHEINIRKNPQKKNNQMWRRSKDRFKKKK